MHLPGTAPRRDPDPQADSADGQGHRAEPPLDKRSVAGLAAGRLLEPACLARAAVTFPVLLGALGFVPWRQSRTLEARAEWDELQRQVSIARAQVVELEREIQVLGSRGRIVPEARERLGMHTPEGAELVILEAEPTS